MFDRPFLRRLSWHARRFTGAVNPRNVLRIALAVSAITVILAVLVLAVEGKPITPDNLGPALNWSVHAVFGKGDSAYITTLGGFVVSWLVVLFATALVGLITAALVAVAIEYLLKEGQGMGAAGMRGHVVICGWNSSAKELINELTGDDYKLRTVVISDSDRNPAGEGTYFVKGDPTLASDLERAGIAEASAAIVFPSDDSREADMRSILTILAIETLSPTVRTIVSVNNPELVEHFRRARVDEILVPARLTSRLIARAAIYPGLSSLVTDIVSGGTGSELYRVVPPLVYVGLSVDELSRRLRADHRATLVAIIRDGQTVSNPPVGLTLHHDDDLVVVAESLGKLTPAADPRGTRSKHPVAVPVDPTLSAAAAARARR